MKYSIFWFRICCFFLGICSYSTLNSAWRWECIDGYCAKYIITNDTEEDAMSLSVCRLLCSEYATVWPKPTGIFSTDSNRTVQILDANNIAFTGYDQNSPSTQLFNSAIDIFQQEITALNNSNVNTTNGKSLSINIDVQDSSISRLTLTTNENYTLNITTNDNVNVYITANNFFGARHALATLAQLIVLDDLRDQIVILSNVYITDGPAYPLRGISLDTSRSYIDPEVIKSTLRGMGISKLNNFHWHITDSQSFPFVSKTYPELSTYGAYSPQKVYTSSIIQEIVNYALARGVRVLPELDAPAHVGEGWQNTGFVTCFNWQPYRRYCLEAPCGQFDPTQDGLYDMLEGIYGDLLDEFNPDPDVFHIGGDEVNFHCWNSTENIVEWMQNNNYDTLSEDGFVDLWDYYLNKSVDRLYQRTGKEIPLITWQSSLTYPAHLSHLSKDRYIIQIWLNSSILTNYILEQGYNIIISNFNAMYLDCGFGSFYDDSDGYCSYNSWKRIYGNTPEAVAGERKSQVVGSEVAFWSEQGGSEAAETRIWPRAAALAEVVWSEPEQNSWQQAEQRFLVHWERLIEHGVKADAPQPEWCLQNEENCSLGSHFYNNPREDL